MRRRPSRRLVPITAAADRARGWTALGYGRPEVGAAYRDVAKSLIEMVVGKYVRLHDAAPRELLMHAKSANVRGSAPAAAKARISWAFKIAEARDDLKLLRPGDYPVIRGTTLQIGERHAFLWTAGYAPRLDTFTGPETPNPISVKILRGNCSLQAVLSDALGLTKINFNWCLHNDRLPVTLRFANAVATISSPHRWTASRSCLSSLHLRLRTAT